MRFDTSNTAACLVDEGDVTLKFDVLTTPACLLDVALEVSADDGAAEVSPDDGSYVAPADQ